MELLEKFKLLIDKNGADEQENIDGLLEILLDNALGWVVSYTGRTDWADGVPIHVVGTLLDVAVSMYNKRGIEGMKAHREGGLTYTVEDVPAQIRRVLNAYRLIRTISWGKTGINSIPTQENAETAQNIGIPMPPSEGTFVLQSIAGELEWIGNGG
jgi:hypothetical protein